MKAFVAILNQLCCLKAHLYERTPDLALQAPFSKINFGIRRFIKQTDVKLFEIDQVFTSILEKASFFEFEMLIANLDELYDQITNDLNEPELAHLLLENYLLEVSRAEEVSLSLLKLATVRLNRPELTSHFDKEMIKPEDLLVYKLKSAYPESFNDYSKLLRKSKQEHYSIAKK
jgi:hypothetical protein